MGVFFTSDTHFYHNNIIDFCDRDIGIPKNSDREERVEAMNEVLIDCWNERIKPTDEVFHLGDFAFSNKTKRTGIIQRLNGHKRLIRGNHDPDSSDWWKEAGFDWVRDYYVYRHHDQYEDDEGNIQQYHQPIVLMHFPILSWENMHHGFWHLHGHCHGSLPETRMMRMDVGVDTNNLYPYSYEDIKKVMVMRSVVPVDHHGS